MKALLALSLICTAVASIVNREVTRVVDASTSVVRVTTDIKAANVEKEYKLIIDNALAKRLSFLSVTSKNKALNVQAPVS